ncbi:hypothetical protein NDN17_17575 [Shewanella algae]|uniref:hypothetical protein n=1 Tax=Shewanella algae TaxID=38313 RepID=UPI0016563F12|nr:hypothetical protein [Shewanella algae]MBC8797265.1 hypothetical protein [Shewanella algae]MCM2530314.1 hypothetical protein [Shewanella algae]
MAHTFTDEQRRKGGANSKRGKGKKTIAREILAAVIGDDEQARKSSLELLDNALSGKQGGMLQLELVKLLFESSLQTAGAVHVAEHKQQLRNKELVLAAILRQSNQKQALELYKALDSQTDDDEQDDDEEQGS